MKKLAIIILVLAAISLAAVYYLIPSSLNIIETASTSCVTDAAFRKLSDENDWIKWWPGKIISKPEGNKAFQVGNTSFSVSKKMMNNLGVVLENDDDKFESHIGLLNIPHDSTIIKWQCTLSAGNNPFARIKAYRTALSLKSSMSEVINAAQTYLSKFENIYGFKFNESSTNDTTLVTTRALSDAYPSTTFVYNLIDKLKAFCVNSKCTVTGVPMLNVTPVDSNKFQVMVALPIEHGTTPNGDIKIQKMIPGRFVITEVTGGPYSLAQAHRQIIHYFQDYHRTSMAIPFEYLLTDRLKETDTSKWQTRIYSPVY